MAVTLKAIKDIMHSNQHVSEFLYVLAGIKPCARFTVDIPALKQYYAIAQEYGMHVVAGDRVQLSVDHRSGQYANKGIVGTQGNAQLIYLSMRKSIAEHARLLEARGMHKEFGEALGYPRCCCNFFAAAKPDERNDYTGAVFAVTDHDSTDNLAYPWQLNILMRYDDACILPHFPCSMKCPYSLQFAHDCMEVLKHYRPTFTERIQRVLDGTFLFVPGHGSVKLEEWSGNADLFQFKVAAGTTTPELRTALETMKGSIIDKDHVAIDGKTYKAYLAHYVS